MTTTTTPVVFGPAPLTRAVRGCITDLKTRAPGAGAGGWMVEEREAVIADLDAAIQELTVYRGQVLLAHKQDGRWGSISDRDFADYRSRTTGSGRGAAMGDLQLAEGLEAMPAVAKAVEDGDLTLEHAKTLTRLQRGASQEVQKALADGGLEDLVDTARREGLSAPDLGKTAKAWANRIDAAAAQEEFDAVRRRRSFTMRRQGGGVAGEFFLDPIAGEELRIALEAIAGRPAADDERTQPQRMADAVVTLASRVLSAGADRAGAQVRPHLALLVAEETWVGILARRRRFASCPTGPVPPWPNVPAAQLEDGTQVPLGELERLMCDCETTRHVMSAGSIPLDVGHTQRHFTKNLRRAVFTRDRHCQWPDCSLRASWCEVHHIWWWSRGGKTTLSDGITLCSYHHHRVHQHDILITPLPDGFDFHHRNGDHIGTTHRTTRGALCPDPDAARRAIQALHEAAQHTGRHAHTAPAGAPGAPAGLLAAAGPARLPGLPGGAAPPGHGTPAQPCLDPPDGPGNAPPLPADVKLRPPLPAKKTTGPARTTRGTPEPSYPSSYATAPTLWGPDPPF